MAAAVIQIREEIALSGRLVDKFMEIYAIIAIDRQCGYRRSNLPGLTSVREVAKADF
jgi:hypothetical protein